MAVQSSPRAGLATPPRSQRQRQEPQASVSVFFLFLPVATVVPGPLKSCPGVILSAAALRYLPGNKPTPRTRRQSIYAQLRFALFDGGAPACGVFWQCCRCWRAAGLSMFLWRLPDSGGPAEQVSCQSPRLRLANFCRCAWTRGSCGFRAPWRGAIGKVVAPELVKRGDTVYGARSTRPRRLPAKLRQKGQSQPSPPPATLLLRGGAAAALVADKFVQAGLHKCMTYPVALVFWLALPTSKVGNFIKEGAAGSMATGNQVTFMQVKSARLEIRRALCFGVTSSGCDHLGKK